LLLFGCLSFFGPLLSPFEREDRATESHQEDQNRGQCPNDHLPRNKGFLWGLVQQEFRRLTAVRARGIGTDQVRWISDRLAAGAARALQIPGWIHLVRIRASSRTPRSFAPPKLPCAMFSVNSPQALALTTVQAALDSFLLMRKPSVLVIFLTVFIDLVGFGIVVPLVPIYSRHYGAHGVTIGIIIASFSAMQFLFSPIWGRLSDRYGRRPILLISTAGAAASYVLFALSSGLQNTTAALSLMLISRIFAGICGGNITVAQAYIADITPPEQRTKKMGLIGMAFGLGFIFGPAIGGFSLKHVGNSGPGWIAAGLCAANFLLALFILTESLKPSAELEPVPQRPHLDQWQHTLSRPRIGLLIVVFFLATFCFSCFESTLPLIVSDNFHLNIQADETSASTVAYLFVFCGLIGAFVQGGAIGRLVKKFGEPKLIAISLALTGVSMALLPFIRGQAQLSWGVLVKSEGTPWLLMLLALALLSIGTSVTRPPLFGMLSNLAGSHEQGATIGVAQSAGSLARILGPIFATSLLPLGAALPYLICTAVLLTTTLLVAQRLGGGTAASAPPAAASPAK
jgi:MFS transporter, DHA1 family, tetracycline resistance protein